MKRNIEPYYVILWDVNKDTLYHYDIMSYLVDEYKRVKKSRSKYNITPKTFEEFKKFVDEKSMYQFWARCQYEVIVHGWPVAKKDYKLDAYEQIKMNLDIITRHLMSQVL